MQKISQWFAGLSFGDPVVWLAVAGVLAVVLLFLFLGRRPTKLLPVVVGAADGQIDGLGDDFAPPPIRPRSAAARPAGRACRPPCVSSILGRAGRPTGTSSTARTAASASP